MGDLTNDGILDLVVPDQLDDEVDIYMGNGDGTFQPPEVVNVGAEPRFVTLADLTGDGKLDIVTSNWRAGTVSVLAGQRRRHLRARETIHGWPGPRCDCGGGPDRRRHSRHRHGQLPRRHGERLAGQRRRHLPAAASRSRRPGSDRAGRGRPDRRRHPRHRDGEYVRRRRERAFGQRRRHLSKPSKPSRRETVPIRSRWPISTGTASPTWS